MLWTTAPIDWFGVSSVAIALAYHVSFALVWLLTSYIVIGLLESIFNLSRAGLHRRRTRRQKKRRSAGNTPVEEVKSPSAQ